MGTGEGPSYIPYILTSEFNSKGTTSIIKDWKTGRGIHCLSQAEALWYYILRWDDENIDIREQFPLKNEVTVKIADKYNIKHPHSRDYIMTTDFLVTKKNHKLHAYSVKATKADLSFRAKQILVIEQEYWESQGIPFTILFKENVDTVLANNIRLVIPFYQVSAVTDRNSLAKHLIATKQVSLDLSQHILQTPDYEAVLRGLGLGHDQNKPG